jgi:hypothetical protein
MGERNPFHMQEIGKKQIVHKICDGYKKTHFMQEIGKNKNCP